ncbi:MAG: MBL fold metallo-hydrolase [Sphingomonadales bacterium]|nr:MBL fold metallo-hydrolase [Sphingomonadales bacterium]
MKRWHKIIVALLALLGCAFYWLLYDNRPGDTAPAPLDIASLRAAANAMPGNKPDTISVETVARGALADTMLVAGSGFGRRDQGVHSFRIATGDQSIILDSGLSAESNAAMPFYKHDGDAYARVLAALPRARLIVVTHEHLDHIGGVLAAQNWANVSPRTRITREQVDHPEVTAPLEWPKGSRETYQPLSYQGMLPIAPGVVLIKAPSHTPGSQMMFVQLATGREYLFMGDISSMDRNWRETRARSRLVGDLFVGENRAAVFGWLKAFKALHEANPQVVMVPSHDAVTVDEMVQAGLLKRGF